MNAHAEPRHDGLTTDSIQIPDDIESGNSKLIFLSVLTWETASADELCQRLQLDKGTVLSITKTLRERGHLEKRDGKYCIA